MKESSKNGRILVLAFDGMDYELIERYECENLAGSKEFGILNNSEGISTIITNELWASFITGDTWKRHGIIGKNRPESDLLFKIEKFNRFWWWRKFKAVRRRSYELVPFVDSEIRKYDCRDLKIPSIFDKIHESKAIDVRSYNIGYNYDLMRPLKESVELATEELERFTKWKKQELFESMEEEYDLIMAHFHKADHIHHWFWEVGKMDKVEKTYQEMDQLAADIKEKARAEGFDTVIFVSDHGLPTVEKGGHNKNAFYSCNHDLFGEKTPHITEFHDKILEIAGQESDLEGIDI